MDRTIVIAAIQYELHRISSFDEFACQVEKVVKRSAGSGAQLIVLPEYFSWQLAHITSPDGDPQTLVNELAHYRDKIVDLIRSLAVETGTYLVAGTMVSRETSDSTVHNDCYVFSPQGESVVQGKLNVTRYEKEAAGIGCRNSLKVIDADFGKLAVNICYDVEFPELARAASNLGVEILVVPSWTDDRPGFNRVRFCAHARAVENQIYVVHASTVGRLGREPAPEPLWGESAILCPADVGFAANAVVAQGLANREDIVTAACDLNQLDRVRRQGTVLNYRDSMQNTSRRIEASLFRL